ncbi:MAG: SAM-dependent methyltransferase [Acidobacteria bacterium]|nr:SAM-dependent methyltransferase [Acidobacteriota bacterium]
MTGPAAPSPAEIEIRRRLRERGTIPFVEFMELALYHPEGGYYTRATATTGPAGDFQTSSDVSPEFGRRIAVQAAEVAGQLGGGPWQAVELGPGRGLLAADLLDGLAEHAPDALRALERLVLVEVSPSLAALQRERLAALPVTVPTTWVRALDELGERSVRGVVIANEVFDALPVRALERTGGALSELHVAEDRSGRLAFVPVAPADAAAVALAERYGLCPREGERAEVCTALDGLVAAIGRVLERGAVIVIDYGHPAARLADGFHGQGTLLSYHRHRVERDVLARPGEQDITAHVNWDHLADAAAAAGLTVACRATQDRFLLALGILDELAIREDDTPGLLARRLAARSLVMPEGGAGRRFEVVCLVRGIGRKLRGCTDPYASVK